MKTNAANAERYLFTNRGQQPSWRSGLRLLHIAALMCFATMSDGPALLEGKSIPAFAGPYISYMARFEMCTPNSMRRKWSIYMRCSHFNPAKPYAKQALVGNLTNLYGFDDTMWGVFLVNNKEVDWFSPSIPVLPYGHYKMKISLGHSGRNVPYGCFTIENFVIPKP